MEDFSRFKLPKGMKPIGDKAIAKEKRLCDKISDAMLKSNKIGVKTDFPKLRHYHWVLTNAKGAQLDVKAAKEYYGIESMINIYLTNAE